MDGCDICRYGAWWACWAPAMARVLRGREPSRLPRPQCAGRPGWRSAPGRTYPTTGRGGAPGPRLDLAISATSLPYNLAHAIGSGLRIADWAGLRAGAAALPPVLRDRWPAPPAWRAPACWSRRPCSPCRPRPWPRRLGTGLRPTCSKAQNRDGGFGTGPGFDSNALFSGWAALGLAAAGHLYSTCRRGSGRSLSPPTSGVSSAPSATSARWSARRLRLRAAGLSPSRFGGPTWQRRSGEGAAGTGSIGGYASYTAFESAAPPARRGRAPVRTLLIGWRCRTTGGRRLRGGPF